MEKEHEQAIWYACDEHVDIVIDEIVDQYSLAPTMEPYEPVQAVEQKRCSWCGQIPQYLLEIELDEETG